MNNNFIFASESVTEGHPDKVCDRISDSVLDAYLAQDPMSRVACECCATTDTLMIMGEITSKATVDVEKVARKAIEEIGYTIPGIGFDNKCNIILKLNSQSKDIAMGVDKSLESKKGDDSRFDTGAGDQGMMFGYATTETEDYMPFAINYSHKLVRRLTQLRKEGTLDYLRPDGKAQLGIKYVDGKPVAVDSVVVSTQHSEDVSLEQLQADIKKNVIEYVLPEDMITDETRFFINPTGRFVIGGPAGDSGLTGRKIIVDTYGGYAPHGGGAFSGKDPTKVDRSGAYMARYIAKNIVAAGLAENCLIELSYAIGVAHPLSVYIDTKGTGKMDDEKIAKLVIEKFDMRPAAIIERLGLRNPIYTPTSSYGHFGRNDLDLPWERLDAQL